MMRAAAPAEKPQTPSRTLATMSDDLRPPLDGVLVINAGQILAAPVLRDDAGGVRGGCDQAGAAGHGRAESRHDFVCAGQPLAARSHLQFAGSVRAGAVPRALLARRHPDRELPPGHPRAAGRGARSAARAESGTGRGADQRLRTDGSLSRPGGFRPRRAGLLRRDLRDRHAGRSAGPDRATWWPTTRRASSPPSAPWPRCGRGSSTASVRMSTSGCTSRSGSRAAASRPTISAAAKIASAPATTSPASRRASSSRRPTGTS